MLNFIEFIKESGDSHHEFYTVLGDHDNEHHSSRSYRFRDGSTVYDVDIQHDKDSPHKAEVTFGIKDKSDPFHTPYAATGEKGYRAAKILSTIHNIVKTHIDRHPNTTEVEFSSETTTPSRVSLYKRYTTKMGGINRSPNGDWQVIHSIPAKAYK